MTEPTDAELWQLHMQMPGAHKNPIDYARAVLAKWGTPPAVAGEPVAWLSTDCIGERYLCFTKPNDSDPARPLVFGDTAPQPTQPQAGAVPLADYKAYALIDSMGWSLDDQEKDDMLRLLRATEAAHGIKGGQHGTE